MVITRVFENTVFLLNTYMKMSMLDLDLYPDPDSVEKIPDPAKRSGSY
jgi:hypothetical protein